MVTYGNLGTVRYFSRREVGKVFGQPASRLAGWKETIGSASLAESPLVTLDELEYLAACQSPQAIGKAAALRIQRHREREAERIRIAGQLLRANLSTPGKRFSMNDAALARVAAGAQAAELPPKRSALRGEARAAARAEVVERVPLYKVGAQVRGNGRAKVARKR